LIVSCVCQRCFNQVARVVSIFLDLAVKFRVWLGEQLQLMHIS
jgi:hypothetical protein